jgi:hypothetical protein
VEEEPVPVDINNIDFAALGESLGLDPSSNANRRECRERPAYRDYDYKCSPRRRSPSRDCDYDYDYGYNKRDSCSPIRRGGGRDYYGQPDKSYYPEDRVCRSPRKTYGYRSRDSSDCSSNNSRYRRRDSSDCRVCKKGAVDDCLPTDKTIKNLRLQDVLCDDKTECERYCQTPDYGELNFGHAGARSNQG